MISDDYLVAWTEFYPSRALSAGQAEAATLLEDFTQPAVDGWLTVNQHALAQLQALPETTTLDDRIDRQLLEGQIQARDSSPGSEAEIHRTDPQTYSNLINQALTAVLVRKNLTEEMKLDAALARLRRLDPCARPRRPAQEWPTLGERASIRDIRSTAVFIEADLISALGVSDDNPQT